MKILVLGGTQMIGRDFVETIQNINLEYELYLANRGITNKELFSNLNHIQIDRNYAWSCEVLSNYIFDIVIDFSCYNILQFTNVIPYLKYTKYILISTTCSADMSVLNDSQHLFYDYCKNKQKLEEYILNNNIKNTIIVRPCILYGKHDYTNRFYEKNNKIYWKHNHEEVIESKYFINVKTFTKHLYNCIINSLNNCNILQIDGDGMKNI